MSWRTVIISSIAKLDLQAGFLVSREVSRPDRKVILNEIDILIIENSAVSISVPLLIELTRRKVRIILCDEERNPCGEFQPYYGSHDSSARLQEQFSWKEENRKHVWQSIITGKIGAQAQLLFLLKKNIIAEMLWKFLKEVEPGDATNREAQAARLYFPALFGSDFIRHHPDNINAALNYGYSILMSAFNRAITIMGYMTQKGICHMGGMNPFNFGCDLMEPWRPFVDLIVYDMQDELLENFAKPQKRKLIELLHKKICVRATTQNFLNGIEIYARSVISALQSGDVSDITFPILC